MCCLWETVRQRKKKGCINLKPVLAEKYRYLAVRLDQLDLEYPLDPPPTNPRAGAQGPGDFLDVVTKLCGQTGT